MKIRIIETAEVDVDDKAIEMIDRHMKETTSDFIDSVRWYFYHSSVSVQIETDFGKQYSKVAIRNIDDLRGVK